MDTERLIEEVRKFPVLYDQTHEKYRNTEYKARIWRKIEEILEAKGGSDECKKRWASIRDQFRKTLQKRKTVSGQAAVRQRKYKFEDLLEFLLPYMAEPEAVYNVPHFKEDKDVDEVDCVVNTEEEDLAVEQELSQEDNIENELESQGNQSQNVENNPQSSRTSSVRSPIAVVKDKFLKSGLLKRKIPHEAEPQESPSNQFMACILAEKEAENERKKRPAIERIEKHPVDAFLDALAPSLKSLNPILLNQAKKSIFSIVQDFEMKQLMESHNQYSHTE